MPFNKCPRPVYIYLVGTMGYRVNLIAKMFLEERAHDFYEMLLHHIIAVAVGLCTMFGNFSGGTAIGVLHDVSDVFLCLVKTLSTTNYEIPTLAVFAVTIFCFAWTRLYVYPQIIFIFFTREVDPRLENFVRLIACFLCVAQFLHVYWFYLMIKIVVNKIVTGKTEDIREKKEN
jgi:ABC-type proline/glycine betaine transport system permease subunit